MSTYIGLMQATPMEIIDFWRQAGRKAWFSKNIDFDASIRRIFEELHHKAARGELSEWSETPEGSLALLLLLDQFPRNIWRGSAHAFATDPLARHIARSAISGGHDQLIPLDLRTFFYLPLEHSENLADQRECLYLSEKLENDGGESARWARMHHDIIARFGRFPHRNKCLGRETTEEERNFLENGGFQG